MNRTYFTQIGALVFGTMLVLSAGIVAINGQTPSSSCPTFSIAGTQGLLRTGEPTMLQAEAKGETPSNLEYIWAFSTGKILRGQGSADVEYLPVDQVDGRAPSDPISVSLTINGLPEHCLSKYEARAAAAPFSCGLPLDWYGKSTKMEERAHLDNLFIALDRNPGFEGFLIVEFAKNEGRKYKTVRLKSILETIRYRKYDASRLTIVFYDGRDRETTTLQASTGDEMLPNFDSQTYTLIKAEELESKIKGLFKK